MLNETDQNVFKATDALIIYSVYRRNDMDAVIGFKDIILFYDYINHDVLTCDELADSVSRLQVTGWLEVKPEGIRATERYHQWRTEKFKNKKPPSIQKEVKEIEVSLQLNFRASIRKTHEGVSFDREKFEKAKQEYLSH